MEIELRKLTQDCDELEYEMLQGIIDGENGFFNPPYNKPFDDYKLWIKNEMDYSNGLNLPEGWIAQTTYILYSDNIPVGYGRVRHESSDYLENVLGAGNIGYAIAKNFRKQGYGTILFSKLLDKCREFGYKEIKLFPMKDNVATLKIMQRNGGKIIGDFNDEKYKVIITLE